MKSKTLIAILSVIAAIIIVVVLIVVTSGKKKSLYMFDKDDASADMEVANANVKDIEIVIQESFPVQVLVTAYGELSDGCTEVRSDDIIREKVGNTFKVTIETERPRDAICTQAIRIFDETFPLDVANLRAGDYTVDVNGVTGAFSLKVDNLIDFELGEK